MAYANIRRFAAYHFCSNVGELVPFLVWGVSGGAIPLPLTVMQVLAIDLGTDMLPAIALGPTRRARDDARPPRPRGERLLSRKVLARVYGFVGPLEGIGAMTSFFIGFLLGGWHPPSALPDSGNAYLQATTMTQTAIVMGQVGAGQAMRTKDRSVFSIGSLLESVSARRNRLRACTCRRARVRPGAEPRVPSGADPDLVVFLIVWAPVVFFAEEARKAIVRRRRAAGLSAST